MDFGFLYRARFKLWGNLKTASSDTVLEPGSIPEATSALSSFLSPIITLHLANYGFPSNCWPCPLGAPHSRSNVPPGQDEPHRLDLMKRESGASAPLPCRRTPGRGKGLAPDPQGANGSRGAAGPVTQSPGRSVSKDAPPSITGSGRSGLKRRPNSRKAASPGLSFPTSAPGQTRAPRRGGRVAAAPGLTI